MRWPNALVVVVMLVVGAGCGRDSTTVAAGAPSAPSAPTAPSKVETEITITDPSQREAAVDKAVVVIGIQTRTKQPQVNGVDVDGDYALSDKKVVARGVLRKTVVPEIEPSKDEPAVARRGAGTYYAVVDTATKELAKTKPAE